MNHSQMTLATKENIILTEWVSSGQCNSFNKFSPNHYSSNN